MRISIEGIQPLVTAEHAFDDREKLKCLHSWSLQHYYAFDARTKKETVPTDV